MKNLILIGGIPSSGKTTFAKILAEMTGYMMIEADLIYYEIAKSLGREKYWEFANPKEWLKEDQKNLNKLKREYFKSYISNKGENLIIEGFALSFETDRQIINEILNPEKICFFHKNIKFDDWLKQKGKATSKIIEACEDKMNEYQTLCHWATLPNIYSNSKTKIYLLDSF